MQAPDVHACVYVCIYCKLAVCVSTVSWVCVSNMQASSVHVHVCLCCKLGWYVCLSCLCLSL